MSKPATKAPQEALELLLEGNRRFLEGRMTHVNRVTADHREDLVDGQEPFAAVIGCADSRKPLEHIFDAGLGELFVCRNAGNLVDEVSLGSVEYAAAHTGCPLVVVLGHNNCGALGAAVTAAGDPDFHESPSIDEIIRRLLPAVLWARENEPDESKLVDTAAKKNVANGCRHIFERSPLLRKRVREGNLAVVGAWYDLGAGGVEVLMSTLDGSIPI